MQPRDSAPVATYHVVLNVAVERGYPGDPLSHAREAVDFTVHGAREVAHARLLAEHDLNLADEAASALRRSFLLAVNVPVDMCAGGSPHRWVSDRARVLLDRAGGRPGAYARAVSLGTVADLVAADLASAVLDLREAMRGADGMATATAAIACAGATARAARLAVIGPQVARALTGVAKSVATAAWEGGYVEHLAPALEALLRDLPAPGPAAAVA